MLKETIKNILGVHNIKYFKSFFPTQDDKNRNEKNKLFYSQFVRPGDLCFNVGANFGHITQPLLDLGAKVVAVEPQTECYKFLQKKYGSKISIVKKALGNKDEVKEMYISEQTNVISSFSEDWIKSVQESGRFKEGKWDKKELVELTTLDKLIGTYGTPHYIKIDVEGYEYEVLMGLTHKINLISFEFTLPEQIEKSNLCLDYLSRLNSNIECNYALETNQKLELCLKQWVDVKEFKETLKSFKSLHFGDAFIRIKN